MRLQRPSLFIASKLFKSFGGASQKGSRKETTETRVPFPVHSTGYQLIEVLGEGASATVYSAWCEDVGTLVAVKHILLDNLSCDLDFFSQEAKMMRELRHPNLMPLYASFVEGSTLWLVMPYIDGGSLENVVKHAGNPGLSEAVIAAVMKEALKGLEYLHKRRAVHRDVKGGNIMVGRMGEVVLGDFTVTACLPGALSLGASPNASSDSARDSVKVAAGHCQGFAGTPLWMAPEVIEGCSYNQAADVWSVGMTFLELALGRNPLSHLSISSALMAVLHKSPPSLPQVAHITGQRYSQSFHRVVRACLAKDPLQRPSVKELLKMAFFQGGAGSVQLLRPLVQDMLGRVQHTRTPASHCVQGCTRRSRQVGSWDFDVGGAGDAASDEEYCTSGCWHDCTPAQEWLGHDVSPFTLSADNLTSPCSTDVDDNGLGVRIHSPTHEKDHTTPAAEGGGGTWCGFRGVNGCTGLYLPAWFFCSGQ